VLKKWGEESCAGFSLGSTAIPSRQTPASSDATTDERQEIRILKNSSLQNLRIRIARLSAIVEKIHGLREGVNQCTLALKGPKMTAQDNALGSEND
jgi:hypothetical protein